MLPRSDKLQRIDYPRQQTVFKFDTTPGRSTQGVRLVRMEEGDQVAAASVIQSEPESGNGGNGNGQNDLPLQ